MNISSVISSRLNQFSFSLPLNKVDVFPKEAEARIESKRNLMGRYYSWVGVYSNQGIAVLLKTLPEPMNSWQSNRNNPLPTRSSKLAIFLLTLSNCLTSLGYNVPYLFITDRALLAGVESRPADFLLSFIALGNVLGRFLFGALVSCDSKVNHLLVYIIGIWLSGMVICVSFLATNFPQMAVYSLVFGVFSGKFSVYFQLFNVFFNKQTAVT